MLQCLGRQQLGRLGCSSRLLGELRVDDQLPALLRLGLLVRQALRLGRVELLDEGGGLRQLRLGGRDACGGGGGDGSLDGRDILRGRGE